MAQAYATIPDLKARLDIDDSEDDTYLGGILEAVSRSVDDYTGHRFYVNATDETRVYTVQSSSTFECPNPIVSLTSLKTDTTNNGTFDRTWAAADYELWPWNAATDSKPYTEIRVAEDSSGNGYTFETTPRGLQLVGVFGYWTSVPPVIKEATIREARLWYLEGESPTGMQNEELGTSTAGDSPLSAGVKRMLAPFVRVKAGGF